MMKWKFHCTMQEYFKDNKIQCVVLFVESDMIITDRKRVQQEMEIVTLWSK